MDYGLAIFPTDETPGPAELARLAEARGFESLFFPEHTHIPASRETPYPIGGELPREYARLLDPIVALAAAATATGRLRLGTGVCLVAERDPIVTAKAIATLDRISGGRVLFGVGAGWNREELRNHGVKPRERFAVVEERVRAMQAIWTQDEASFAGEHVRFERIWSWPKPLQRPHPPVLVGGNGPGVLDRVLAYGDHWMPNPERSDEVLLARIGELRERARAAGRVIGVTVNAASTKPARLARLAEAGVERAVFYLPSAGSEAIEERLAAIESAVAAVGRSSAPGATT